MAPHSSTLAWQIPWTEAAVHGVAEGRTRLSNFTFTFHFPALEKEMATYSSVRAWRILGMGPVQTACFLQTACKADLSEVIHTHTAPRKRINHLSFLVWYRPFIS